MAKTQGQQIDDLARAVHELDKEHARLVTFVETQFGMILDTQRATTGEVKELRTVQTDGFTKQAERLAAHDEKLAALQRTADRNWQGWLALIGAGVAIVVAVLRK